MSAKNIMFQGTASSAGKSLIASALCRVAASDGIKVAPFKSQNMALNSFITKNGGEMGRAQVTQALCAGIEPEVDMNPILLKPNSEMGSQVIVGGKVWGNLSAQDYYKKKREFLNEALKAYGRLADRHELMVIEGAGSPAEINLRQNDIVNMGFAREVDAPVILVCDIDRGGMFASLYGTVMLQEPSDRELIKGYIVNKFRGDKEILKPGLEMMDELIGLPCLGVMPYLNLDLDDEDSLTERFGTRTEKDKFTVAVIRLKHISNISDFTAFGAHDGVEVVYPGTVGELRESGADILIIPGSKNVMDDMRWLNETGMASEILKKVGNIPIIGVCGGYQIMGDVIEDPNHVEGVSSSVPGLGIFKARTVLKSDKTTRQVRATAYDSSRIGGYEIHMGETELEPGLKPFAVMDDGRTDGVVLEERKVYGTYIHGVFDNDCFRTRLLKEAGYRGPDANYKTYMESQFDKLAQAARDHLDLDRIYEIAGVKEGIRNVN